MARVEEAYKQFLPMPNPDVHEVIGEKLDMKPSIVFFAINLIRQKMKLPKLEYPKRKLAVTPEQLMAIEALYEPYLPLPPIGIHKIIAKQLRIDEWRVHVAIGLIRKNKNMDRWNEERDDLPEAMKAELEAAGKGADLSEDDAEAKPAKKPAKKKAAVKKADDAEEAKPKRKRTTKAKVAEKADDDESASE
jgi:hypothetical protein